MIHIYFLVTVQKSSYLQNPKIVTGSCRPCEDHTFVILLVQLQITKKRWWSNKCHEASNHSFHELVRQITNIKRVVSRPGVTVAQVYFLFLNNDLPPPI